MSAPASLSAAADDRKARLAQLKSLKRKQAPTSSEGNTQDSKGQHDEGEDDADALLQPDAVTIKYLSGRNYDPETRGAKLGFESAPTDGQTTLEAKANVLAETTKKQQEEEEKADKPLDLFKLQPKKPNWDLKRDLEKKLEVLNARTDNAIARMVRERLQSAQKEAKANGENGESVGMEGAELVEAMHMREREEEEDERREREEVED